MLAKYTDLITFGEELLENKQVPYEGLVIETSNAQHGMFSFKPNHCNQTQVFWSKIYQNTNIYMDYSEISLKPLH